jgi:hypothetical protein
MTWELDDTGLPVDVSPAEYVRLLGYPRGWALEGRAEELADWARAWYARHGRPWIYARQAGPLGHSDRAVTVAGVPFSSARLDRARRDAAATDSVLAAVGAGPELENEARRLWQDGRPDEYFFLEVYGSAVVEHLITTAGARLCAWADTQGLAVLPHDSPGYPDWPIDEQARLLDAINLGRGAGPVDVSTLESGMLRPKKSLLAVFALTRLTDDVRRLTDMVPCERCGYRPCQYRRAPYRRLPPAADPELSRLTRRTGTPAEPPLDTAAVYSTNPRALGRWSGERLSLERREDGSVRAVFRYEGTTCTNMGRSLEFHYHVTLGPRDEGYRIVDQRCEPAPGDHGHAAMCRYLTAAESLMAAIREERPLAGRPLNDVLSWRRTPSVAGCYCEPDSRTYKWGLVLETLHYALAQEERSAGDPV